MKPHPVLLPLSWIFGALVWMRNLFFDIGFLKQTKVNVPVISVGNITTGGTGKTPIVKNIANILIESGKKVAIVSRGYGRLSKGFHVVSDGKNIVSNVEDAGDESFYLAQQVKEAIVIVDEQRVRGSQKAIEQFGAQVILLDDGFQHRFLQREVDIVLIDSGQSVLETKLLPAGFRREFLSSLQRADAVVFTKSERETNDVHIVDKKTFTSTYEPIRLKNVFDDSTVSIESLHGKKIVAFCGIAKPVSFRRTLEGCGLKIEKFLTFDDHHKYSNNDVRMIIDKSQKYFAEAIVTTEKDAVKIKKYVRDFFGSNIFAVVMEARVYPEIEWKDWILKQVER